MASNSGWTTNLPSGQSKVSQVDDELRSLKSFQEAWLEEEHYVTDGSANSAGVHKLGSARAFVGTTSQLSNPTGDNSGRLMHTTDDGGLWVANASTSSWTLLTNSITLGSQQTFTALQEFSAGVEASNVSVNGIFSGWTSYSTFTNLASIASNNVNTFIATNGPAANVAVGDFIVAHRSGNDEAFAMLQARASNGSISFSVVNTGTLAADLSAQTFTAFIFKRGHLQ